MRYLILLIICCLLLTACTNDQITQPLNDASNHAKEHTTPTLTPIKLDPTATILMTPAPAVEEVKPIHDITFADFHILPEINPSRELNDVQDHIHYTLREYTIHTTIEAIDEWLREETKRLGVTLIERASYNVDEERLDLIIKLPSQTGTRILSSYVQQYLDLKYLILIETEFPDAIDIDSDYEDHALVISVPQPNLTSFEIFKGMYPHQHTDIYAYYFYSEAYLAELNYHTTLLNGKTLTEDDYLVGYFDKDGNEVSAYDIPQDQFDDYTFGVQIRSSFLPPDQEEQEQLLFHWAKTLLIGNRAYSYVDDSKKANFLKGGEIFKSYSFEDVVK